MQTTINTTEPVFIVKDTTANPAPLGLLCFGLTTVLLNLHNAGLYAMDSVILGMGIFVGGIAQIFAGLQEFKKNNTFGATAFCAYGSFWLSLVAVFLLPKTSIGTTFPPSEISIASYLLLWGIFTLFMFIGTLKLSRLLQLVFFTLFVLYFLLAISAFTGNDMLHTIAGYEGILCGLIAVYGSFAGVLNEVYNRTVLPV